MTNILTKAPLLIMNTSDNTIYIYIYRERENLFVSPLQDAKQFGLELSILEYIIMGPKVINCRLLISNPFHTYIRYMILKHIL